MSGRNQAGCREKMTLLGLDQWFSTEGNVASRGHLAMSGDGSDGLGEAVLLGSRQRLGTLLSMLQCTRKAPRQGILWFTVSMVLREREALVWREGQYVSPSGSTANVGHIWGWARQWQGTRSGPGRAGLFSWTRFSLHSSPLSSKKR